MSRYAARTDAHQPETVALLRGAGWSVAVTHRLGNGFPDLTVGKHGVTLLVELKSRGGKLTPHERVFIEDWRGSPVIVAYSPEETLEKCEAMLASNENDICG